MSNTHISVDVFDYERKHLCNLYDSDIQADGQAYDIVYKQDQNGWKELAFNLPFIFRESKKRNFRWNYIRSEYLIRISFDDYRDWFIIHSPKRTKNGKGISNAVKCSHISVQLKTKNLYLSFDDTNGIGTIDYLAKQILRNTGWSLGECDTFFEADGTTEKIRSLISDGKQGAYKLITDACNLFNAYPVYEGETNKVNIYSANNHPSSLIEMTMEKDIDSLSVEHNSEDLITRLYVEGEYGDFGYVGIDNINPTHLPYIMNFDYYKRIGLFTDQHQAALDTYYERIQPAVESINSITSSILTQESQMSTMWGAIDYAIFPVDSGSLLSPILSRDIETEYIDSMKGISAGDAVTVLYTENGENRYREIYAEDGGAIPGLNESDIYVLKVRTYTPINGTIGAKQIAVEAKQEIIKSKQKEIDNLNAQDREDQINKLKDDIAEIQSSIDSILFGNDDGLVGLYDMMRNAIELALSINDLYEEKDAAIQIQDDVEADFIISMGNLLKDGYWNDDNYTVGQEQSQYNDAVELLNRMSKPKVTYTVSLISLSGILGYKNRIVPLNSMVHLYDNELDVNDTVHVSSVTKYLDAPEKDTVELSNEPLSLTSITVDSILSRMVQLSDLIDQKNSLYSRSEIISSEGSIHANRLEGTINVLKNRLSSANSGWYTDTKGNMVFESVNGLSAMMLTGEGFMIASGKDENGNWDWRTKRHWFSLQ